MILGYVTRMKPWEAGMWVEYFKDGQSLTSPLNFLSYNEAVQADFAAPLITLTLPGPSAGVSGSLDSYSSLTLTVLVVTIDALEHFETG